MSSQLQILRVKIHPQWVHYPLRSHRQSFHPHYPLFGLIRQVYYCRANPMILEIEGGGGIPISS